MNGRWLVRRASSWASRLGLRSPEPGAADSPAHGPVARATLPYRLARRGVFSMLLLAIVMGAAAPGSPVSPSGAGRQQASSARHRARRSELTASDVALDTRQAPAAATASGEAVPDQSALAEARLWLARELHDGAVQHLTVMAVEIEQLRRRAVAGSELEHLRVTTRAAINDLRRLLYELRDEPAFDAHFVPSVRELLAELAGGTGIEADLVVRSWPEELPFHLSTSLRRVAGEALNNVRRHSGATRVTVTLQALDGSLAVTVADNGRGIASAEGGFGLRGMGERARLMGGRVTVESPPGRGTTVRCIVPFGGIT